LVRGIALERKLLEEALFERAGETDGDENQIGLDVEVGALDRLAALVDPHAVHPAHPAIATLDADRSGGELALGAFGLARRGAELGRPVGPDQQLVLVERGIGRMSSWVTETAP
jgi:hypothetical protein